MYCKKISNQKNASMASENASANVRKSNLSVDSNFNSYRSSRSIEIKTHVAKISYKSKNCNQQQPEIRSENQKSKHFSTNLTIEAAKNSRLSITKPLEYQSYSSESNDDEQQQPVLHEVRKPVIIESNRTTSSPFKINNKNIFADKFSVHSAPVSYRRNTSIDLECLVKTNRTSRERTRQIANSNTLFQRSHSAHLPQSTKSQLQTEPYVCDKKKDKFYDPEKTRQYMAEQRLKRRSSSAAAGKGGVPPVIEKELIKKRLEELKGKSRKIVNNNLKRKFCTADKGETTKAEENEKAAVKKCNEVTTAKAKSEEINSMNVTKRSEVESMGNVKWSAHTESDFYDPTTATPNYSENISDEYPTLHLSIPNSDSSRLRKEAKKAKKHPIVAEYNRPSNPTVIAPSKIKQMGIARKQEIDDHSYSAIHGFSFENETVARQMLDPHIVTKPPHAEVKLDETRQNNTTIESNSNTLKDCDNPYLLDFPFSVLAATRNARREQEAAKRNQSLGIPHESKVPYWLKPSAVQIYPYNFIVAVRRKLDAIARPKDRDRLNFDNDEQQMCVAATNTEQTVFKSVATETAFEEENTKENITPLDILDKTQKQNSKSFHSTSKEQRQALSFISDTTKDNCSTYAIAESNKIKKISKPNMNDSQVSSVNYGNGYKQMKKKLKEQDSDEDTTAPSSVFSSPEKRKGKVKTMPSKAHERTACISPLSLECVEDLKVVSKHEDKKRNPQNFNNLQVNLKPETNNIATGLSKDFTQFLNDFNRSLSHVIKVNEKLKSTLGKTRSVGKHRSKSLDTNSSKLTESNSNKTPQEYSSNFEESSHRQNSDNMAFEGPDNVKIPSKNLSQTNNVAQTLGSLQKSEYSSGNETHKTDSKQMDIVEIVIPELNLDSQTNSSAFSSSFSKSWTEYSDLVTQPFEGEVDSNEGFEENPRITTETFNIEHQDGDDRTFITNNTENNVLPVNMHACEGEPLGDDFDRTVTLDSASEKDSKYPTTQSSHDSQSTDKSNRYQTYTKHDSETFIKSPSVVSETFENVAYESSNKENDATYVRSKRSHRSKSQESKRRLYEQAAKTRDAFVQTHINSSRGDFTVDLDCSMKSDGDNLQLAIIESQKRSPLSLNNKSAKCNEASAVIPTIPPPAYLASLSTRSAAIATAKGTKKVSSTPSVAYYTHRTKTSNEFWTIHNGNVSESSISYSSVGMYEQLINEENSKSEHLTNLLKMRQKSILSRAKNQIAILELQKERYKSKGLMMQINAIRKKQRAILMKMENERKEINRLLQSAVSASSEQSTARKYFEEQEEDRVEESEEEEEKAAKEKTESFIPKFDYLSGKPSILCTEAETLSLTRKLRERQRIRKNNDNNNGTAVISANSSVASVLRASYELETTDTLKALLEKRERDLRRRHNHVKRLLNWHQKLDQEEQEIFELERMLLNYNNGASVMKQQQSIESPKHNDNVSQGVRPSESKDLTPKLLKAQQSPNSQHESTKQKVKMEKRLRDIDKSLRELSSISDSTHLKPAFGDICPETACTDAVHAEPANSVEYVRTNGSKLNRLWRRLTSQQIEKFEPNRRYKLCKADLQRLYEEAKCAVLHDFAQVDELSLAADLLDRSSCSNAETESLCHELSQRTIKSGSNLQLSLADVNTNNASLDDCPQSSLICVPSLNLNFSQSSLSDDEPLEDNCAVRTVTYSAPHRKGNYSPSAAEENFNAKENLQTQSQESIKEGNLQKFLLLSRQAASERGKVDLERSLSDTQISSMKHNENTIVSVLHQYSRTLQPMQISTFEDQTPHDTLTSYDTLQSVQSIKTETSLTQTLQTTTPSSAIASANIPFVSENAAINADAEWKSEISPKSVGSENSISSMPDSNDSNESSEDAENRVHIECLTANSQILNRNSVIVSVGDANHSVIATAKEHENEHEREHEKNSFALNNSRNNTEYKSESPADQLSTDVDSKSREIAAKLDEISLAVSRLAKTKSSGTPLQDSLPLKSEQSPETWNRTYTKTVNTNAPSRDTNHKNDGNIEEMSSPHLSYSWNFENSSTDFQSRSGCTLNAMNTKNSNSVQALDSYTFTNSRFVQTPKQSSEEYELDFETSVSDVTNLDDVTMPECETTLETSQLVDNEENKQKILNKENNNDDINNNANSLGNYANKNQEKTQSNRESSTIAIENDKFKNRDNLTSTLVTTVTVTSPPPPPPPLPLASTSASPQTTTVITNSHSQPQQQQQQQQQHLMPDIINELEIRRCQQLILENEWKQQYEHVTAVPYMYVREIPNKPPPPYCPPAHGSPLTTIFPSEERIKDLTYRRSHELYCELTKTDYVNEKGEKLPSVMEEKITNIYERIVLDICREFLNEHSEVLAQGDPANFRSQLAFFNPPDRLHCVQQSIYKEVRRCLAMDKTSPKRTPIYSVYGQRAKRDHIGKIIIQEMYEEDEKWCNFQCVESEVLDLIFEEMVKQNIEEITDKVLMGEASNNCLDMAQIAGNCEARIAENTLSHNGIKNNNGLEVNENGFRENHCNPEGLNDMLIDVHVTSVGNHSDSTLASISPLPSSSSLASSNSIEHRNNNPIMDPLGCYDKSSAAAT